MNSEGRAVAQQDLVRRIAVICTRLVPDDLGVELRFINADRSGLTNLRADAVERFMSELRPDGYTEIGLNLKRKILKPLVYDVITRGGKLERPVFVSIITDGIPGGGDNSSETTNTLRNTIIECMNFLQAKRLPIDCKSQITFHYPFVLF